MKNSTSTDYSNALVCLASENAEILKNSFDQLTPNQIESIIFGAALRENYEVIQTIMLKAHSNYPLALNNPLVKECIENSPSPSLKQLYNSTKSKFTQDFPISHITINGKEVEAHKYLPGPDDCVVVENGKALVISRTEALSCPVGQKVLKGVVVYQPEYAAELGSEAMCDLISSTSWKSFDDNVQGKIAANFNPQIFKYTLDVAKERANLPQIAAPSNAIIIEPQQHGAQTASEAGYDRQVIPFEDFKARFDKLAPVVEEAQNSREETLQNNMDTITKAISSLQSRMNKLQKSDIEGLSAEDTTELAELEKGISTAINHLSLEIADYNKINTQISEKEAKIAAFSAEINKIGINAPDTKDKDAHDKWSTQYNDIKKQRKQLTTELDNLHKQKSKVEKALSESNLLTTLQVERLVDNVLSQEGPIERNVSREVVNESTRDDSTSYSKTTIGGLNRKIARQDDRIQEIKDTIAQFDLEAKKYLEELGRLDVLVGEIATGSRDASEFNSISLGMENARALEKLAIQKIILEQAKLPAAEQEKAKLTRQVADLTRDYIENPANRDSTNISTALPVMNAMDMPFTNSPAIRGGTIPMLSRESEFIESNSIYNQDKVGTVALAATIASSKLARVAAAPFVLGYNLGSSLLESAANLGVSAVNWMAANPEKVAAIGTAAVGTAVAASKLSAEKEKKVLTDAEREAIANENLKEKTLKFEQVVTNAQGIAKLQKAFRARKAQAQLDKASSAELSADALKKAYKDGMDNIVRQNLILYLNQNNAISCVAVLADRQDLVNMVLDGNGNTIAHIAAEKGDLDLLKGLFNLGADLNAENAAGKKPIDIATENQSMIGKMTGVKSEIVQYLENVYPQFEKDVAKYAELVEAYEKAENKGHAASEIIKFGNSLEPGYSQFVQKTANPLDVTAEAYATIEAHRAKGKDKVEEIRNEKAKQVVRDARAANSEKQIAALSTQNQIDQRRQAEALRRDEFAKMTTLFEMEGKGPASRENSSPREIDSVDVFKEMKAKQVSKLMQFAKDNNAKDMEAFLTAYPDLVNADRDGNTAMHIAAASGHVDALKVLIKHGADRTITNKDNKTPIQLAEENKLTAFKRAHNIMNPAAAYNDTQDAVEFLKTDGLAEAMMPKKDAPLMIMDATPEQKQEMESVKQAQQKQATLERQWFDIAADGDNDQKTVQNINKFLEQNPNFNVNVKNAADKTAMHILAERDMANSLATLRLKGGDALKAKTITESRNGKNSESYKLLEAITSGDALKTMTYILNSPVADATKVSMFNDLNAKMTDKERELLISGTYDKDDNTALHMAAKRGEAGLVTALVDAGANMLKPNKALQTPVDVAKTADVKTFFKDQITQKEQKAREIKLSRMVQTAKNEIRNPVGEDYQKRQESANKAYDARNQAEKQRHKDLVIQERNDRGKAKVDDVKAAKASKEKHDAIAFAGLLDAAAEGNLSKVKATLEERPYLLEFRNGSLAPTPLTEAAFKGQTKVVEFLLDQGADIAAPGFNGNTALHMAALGDSANLVEILMKRGANLHAVNADGKTAGNLSNLPNTTKRYLAEIEDAQNRFRAAIVEGNDSNTKLILQVRPYLLNSPFDKEGNTLLHKAAENAQAASARKLIALGADIYQKNAAGKDPYDLAVGKTDLDSKSIAESIAAEEVRRENVAKEKADKAATKIQALARGNAGRKEAKDAQKEAILSRIDQLTAYAENLKGSPLQGLLTEYAKDLKSIMYKSADAIEIDKLTKDSKHFAKIADVVKPKGKDFKTKADELAFENIVANFKAGVEISHIHTNSLTAENLARVNSSNSIGTASASSDHSSKATTVKAAHNTNNVEFDSEVDEKVFKKDSIITPEVKAMAAKAVKPQEYKTLAEQKATDLITTAIQVAANHEVTKREKLGKMLNHFFANYGKDDNKDIEKLKEQAKASLSGANKAGNWVARVGKLSGRETDLEMFDRIIGNLVEGKNPLEKTPTQAKGQSQERRK